MSNDYFTEYITLKLDTYEKMKEEIRAKDDVEKEYKNFKNDIADKFIGRIKEESIRNKMYRILFEKDYSSLHHYCEIDPIRCTTKVFYVFEFDGIEEQ